METLPEWYRAALPGTLSHRGREPIHARGVQLSEPQFQVLTEGLRATASTDSPLEVLSFGDSTIKWC